MDDDFYNRMFDEDFIDDDEDLLPEDLPFDVPEIVQPGDMVQHDKFYYRSPGDHFNVKRLRTTFPQDYTRVATNIAVAGVSFRADDVNKFVLNDPLFLTLKAEPTNQYDRNAIMVLGRYNEDGESKKVHIGYVPRKIAAFHKAADLQAQLITVFVPYEGKNAGVRMHLWKKGKPEGAMI